ncbi:MAG: FtsQ-type POTRA domain-containing protein [Clostridia bacterium]|nr:FtsQ-type POTRA domain-containing protein [Clostridia bacterium]
MPDSSDILDIEEEQPVKPKRALTFPAAALLFVVFAALAGLNSPYFRVHGVTVQGANYLSDQEILLIADVPREVNIFLVRTREIRRRLMAAPRISSAAVERVCPDTIRISLTERATVAYIPYAGFFIEVDADGRAVAVSEAITDRDIPVIVGLAPSYVAVGEAVRPEGPVMVGSMVGRELAMRQIPNISEVDVSRKDDIVVRTSDGIKVYMGKPADVESRARVLDSILASVREQGLDVEYIDIRVEAKPVIRVRR